MASNLRVDTILPSSGTNVAIGTASGSVTFVGDTDISTNGDVTIGGNLGIGGTLTYEDVTNIDSVGLITARSGIRIGAGTTIGPVSGIITYFGDGSQLTGIDASLLSFSGATKIQANNSGVIVTGILTTTQYRPGEIIETIACMCDGRTISVQSGDYTITDVTAAQDATTSYVDCNGSSINYTPPAGTKQLVYNYEFQFNVDENSGLSHFHTLIDGTIVLPSQRAFSANYPASNYHHAQMRFSAGYTFDLNAGSTDLAQGKLATGSWTSGKIIKVQFREYSASYDCSIHRNHYWNGTTSSGTNQEPIKPTLYIQAIA